METSEPRIIAEEKEFLVVLKPAGWLVHPVSGASVGARTAKKKAAEAPMLRQPLEPTLVSWLLARYPELKGIGPDPVRPGIVHRLDAPVSGVMVVARTPEMYEHLVREFTERKVKKEYAALVHGKVSRDYGTIDFPLARGPKGTMVARPVQQSPRPMSAANRDLPAIACRKAWQAGRAKGEGESQGQVDPHPTPLPARQGEGAMRDALTEFEVMQRWPHKTLLRVLPKTGRMHQIRAHLKAIGHPIIGDALYAIKRYKEKKPAERLMLHAERIGFADLQGQWREYEAPPPRDLA